MAAVASPVVTLLATAMVSFLALAITALALFAYLTAALSSLSFTSAHITLTTWTRLAIAFPPESEDCGLRRL